MSATFSSQPAGWHIDVTRGRIQTFIDGANSLIKDDAQREAGRFNLLDLNFKFEHMLDWVICRPVLSVKHLRVR